MRSLVNFRPSSAIAVGLALAACSPDTDHLQVDLTSQNQSITVQKTALVTQLTGAFVVTGKLGQNASDPETVTWQKFSLVKASDQTHLADVNATADSPRSLDVPIGATETATITIDASTSLATDVADAICGAGGVQIVGTATESSDGAVRPIAGATFTPAGCD